MRVERLDGVANEGRLFLNDVDGAARWQHRLDAGKFFLNVLDDVHRIDPYLAANIQSHGSLVLVIRESPAFSNVVLGVADIAEADRRTADVFDDDVVELRDVFDTAHGAHAGFGRATHDTPAGSLDVFRDDRVVNVLRREVVGVHLVQIEHQVDLPRPAAGEIDAADTVDGLKRAANLLVGDLGQLANGARAADG